MTLMAFTGALELGLIYALLALGEYVSFRVLNLPDLTVDGSFVTGAAASAVLTAMGHPLLGLLAALVCGAACGFITGVLQTKLSVQPILAGILTMTGLYSVNLFIMGGRSNIPLLRVDTVFSSGLPKLAVALLFAAAGFFLLRWFFATRLGLEIRATGDNEQMIRSSSVDSDSRKLCGLAIANALTAISGGVLAQYQQFSDITMGTGMVIIGLASLIIGEVIVGIFVKRKGLTSCLLCALLGACIYRVIIAFVLRLNVPAYCEKLMSAAIVALAISYPAVSRAFSERRFRKGARNA